MPLAYRWGKLCWITTLHLGGNVLDIWMTLLWKMAWKYIGNQSFFSIWMSVFLVHHAISYRWLAILILIIIRTRPAYVSVEWILWQNSPIHGGSILHDCNLKQRYLINLIHSFYLQVLGRSIVQVLAASQFAEVKWDVSHLLILLEIPSLQKKMVEAKALPWQSGSLLLA